MSPSSLMKLRPCLFTVRISPLDLVRLFNSLSSLDLVGILLGVVAPREDLLLAELGVLVKAKLGVHGEDLVVGGLGERVDLELSGILLHEDTVEVLDGGLGILDALLREAKVGGDGAGNLVGDTGVDVDLGGEDSLGVLLGDGLNVHTTLGRSDNDGALGSTVHEDGKVEFATSELALDNVYGVARAASSTSLLGDELVSDHLVGEHLGFGRTEKILVNPARISLTGSLYLRVDHPDTTLQTVVEVTLSTATSKNLGLDNQVIVT